MSRRKLYAYYYPAHHRSQSGWFEWDLVRNAQPWFPGHAKPDRPLWGELDDTDPATFLKQAQAAHAAGIDGFVIDTWWRPDGATLYEDAWTRGILPALESPAFPPDFGIGVLWVPVWPRVSLPVGMDEPSFPTGIDRLFEFTSADLVKLVDHLAPRLSHPRAITIDGRPLLSFFHGWRLHKQLGGGLGPALDAMRKQGESLGIGAPWLSACINQGSEGDLLDHANFDALTSYVWWPDWNGPARQDFDELKRVRFRDWHDLRSRIRTPYFPSVTVGWDATPRGKRDWDGERRGFPYTPVIEGNSPASVASAIREAIDFLDVAGLPADRPVLVASWNEWSESHRIEPCERLGSAYLDAIAAVRK